MQNSQYIMTSPEIDFKIIQNKRSKVIVHDNFRYLINKKTPKAVYLRCFQKCGVTMNLNPELTEITKFPEEGFHNHEDEKEAIDAMLFKQKIIKVLVYNCGP